VISEETASISVVMAGEMVSGLDAAQLRVVLRDAMSGSRELETSGDLAATVLESESGGDDAELVGDESDSPEGEATATPRAKSGRRARSAG
jgi:hypothetical protein